MAGLNLAERFDAFAQATARVTGRPGAAVVAMATVVVWGALGPVFAYSDTWQLVINTGTTIITFLMVFLIQNTQNRDTAALQIKLDELIRVTAGANTALLDLEAMPEEKLEQVRRHYAHLARVARTEQALSS